ncbi:hypothetical protein [Kitasatospora sp. NPDC058402]|uniref:hypothetical protein n=1 Tax=Kitasatospora sp. NPDC058402 TaxID=3346481 RepID=UPI003667FC34
MARRPPRVFREVVTGPTKVEKANPPAGWNPLDDYRAAQAIDRGRSPGDLLQIAAVKSTCSCKDCVGYRKSVRARL